MSEFTIGGYEELRPLGEVYNDLRDRAGEMLGHVATRMGFGEASIAYSTEGNEPAADNGAADMADEKEEKQEVVVEDKTVVKEDGKEVNVHIEWLPPGSTDPNRR